MTGVATLIWVGISMFALVYGCGLAMFVGWYFARCLDELVFVSICRKMWPDENQNIQQSMSWLRVEDELEVKESLRAPHELGELCRLHEKFWRDNSELSHQFADEVTSPSDWLRSRPLPRTSTRHEDAQIWGLRCIEVVHVVILAALLVLSCVLVLASLVCFPRAFQETFKHVS